MLRIHVDERDLIQMQEDEEKSDLLTQRREENIERPHKENLEAEEKRHLDMMSVQLKSIELSERKENSDNKESNANKSIVKLHPLKPMEFNGEVTEYPGFISNWNATVDCQDIADGIKLPYLQDALGPIPRKCIASLKSNNEYKLALAL